MAAGLGTRLRPLTHEIPKPLVPVANRPIMEHILRRLAADGCGEVIANLHWFPDTIRDRFGDGSDAGVELTYSYEEHLLGTAGGVRNVRDYFGSEPFVVMAGDALTDIDLAVMNRAHAENDWIATLAVKRVTDTTQYGVIVTGADGRVQGFQEKPDQAEALSDLANCMIYVLEPEIFDYFPDTTEADVPFGVHVTDAYWNDVGSLPEYLQGNLDVLTGAVDVEPLGRVVDSPQEADLADVELSGPVLIGDGVEVGAGARLDGPLVIGPGASIGAGAMVRQSVLLAGAEVPADGLLAGAIAGNASALAAPPAGSARE